MKAALELQHRMQKLVSLQQKGSVSTTDFCKKHQVKAWVFRYWRRKFTKDKINRPNSRLGGKQPPQFIPVPINNRLPSNTAENIEIHYPSGVFLKLPVHFDIHRLYGLINSKGEI